MEVPAAAPLGPIPNQSAHGFGHICAAESLSDELTESGFGTPRDKALFLQQRSPFGKLALKHSRRGLDFAKFQIFDKLRKQLVKIQAVRLLQDKL